jgi:Rod binding domain-containing protein
MDSDMGSDMDSDGGLDLGSGSGSGGALADFASGALGQALSERGGFGVADKIVRELSHTHSRGEPGVGAGIGTQRVTGKVTVPPHGNTVMRTDQ